jgi:TetR/AcrR family transcriptional repressor of nem operon
MPMPEPTIHHDSKTRLLDAAMHVFRASGYAASTVDDVCKAAGLTKGSFFHHFKSKDELAIAAAEHFGTMATGYFAGAPYHRHQDPLERVLGYIDFRAAIISGSIPEFSCYFGTMVQETFESHPAIRAACEGHMSAHVAELVKDIAAAKKKYAPRARWSPESVAWFTQAALQGAFLIAKAKNSPAAATECIAHLRQYLVLLFRTNTTTKKEKTR